MTTNPEPLKNKICGACMCCFHWGEDLERKTYEEWVKSLPKTSQLNATKFFHPESVKKAVAWLKQEIEIEFLDIEISFRNRCRINDLIDNAFFDVTNKENEGVK